MNTPNSSKIHPSVFIHPTAEIENDVEIGEGTRIWRHCHIRRGAKIGSHCNLGHGVYIDTNVVIGDRVKIQNGVSVYEGVILEDEVFVGPNASFTNDPYPRAFDNGWKKIPTRVCRGASFGANATIICGITVGEYAMVGAGAVVTSNVLPNSLMVGNPARKVGTVGKDGYPLKRSPSSLQAKPKPKPPKSRTRR
jgi:UDP-2-acetamido-3-amino-2,3-dideoxy-glucuronate N-acetyltransferase